MENTQLASWRLFLHCCTDDAAATQVDPSIMGGVVVDIGDKHIDMSIASRVKTIQQLVMQTL